MSQAASEVSWEGKYIFDRKSFQTYQKREQVASMLRAFSSKLLAEHASLVCHGAVRSR